jgi:hypothetical protein
MPARGAGGGNGAAAVAAAPAHKDYKFETLAKGLITLDSNNYMSWKKVIENFEYFRDWTPEWKVLTEAQGDYWDGVEEDDPEVKRSRKEAYMALYSSIPTSSAYHHLLSGVRRGDANQIWRNVTQIFMPGDTANKGTLRTELHTMSMASTRFNVSNFGAAVNVKAEQLALVGEIVSDADKKNVFLDGLSKHFSFIVTLQRNNNDDYNKTHAKVIAHAKKENLLDVRDKGIPQFRGTNFFTQTSGHQSRQRPQQKRPPQHRQGNKFPKARSMYSGNQSGSNRRNHPGGSQKPRGNCYNCGGAGHFAAKCTKPKRQHNHEQKYNTPSASMSHFMVRAIDPIADDHDDSEVECSPDEGDWGPFVEDEAARPEADLNASRKTVEIITKEKRKYHEITSMSKKTESKLQSSLYMIRQLEDRVESIEEDVEGAKDQVDSIQGDVDNVHDHMLEIEVQQEDRRNHLIVQQEKTDDLTARVKSLEAHLVRSEEKDRQQTELILRLQKRVGALEGNREQSVERKCCEYKGCNAPVYYDVSRSRPLQGLLWRHSRQADTRRPNTQQESSSWR